MSEDRNAPAAAGGDTNAAPEKPLLASDSVQPPAETKPAASDTPSWREDWREALAGEDTAFLKQLQRHKDPDSFAKSYRDMEKRRGAQVPVLGENPTPEEVAAYRKAAGVPEAPDGYGFAFPEEIGATEADAAALAKFQEHMHANHVPPSAAKAAFDFYLQSMQAGREAQSAAADELALQNIAELRQEYKGREWSRMFGVPGDPSRPGVVGEFLNQQFGELRDTIMEARLQLPDGGTIALGNYAPFVKQIAAMALANADEESLIAGDVSAGGQTEEQEYRALIRESAGNAKAWEKSGKQARLDYLAARVAKRNGLVAA